MTSPPPDYMNAIGEMFDGTGGGPLDSIPGIPRKGEVSELGGLMNQWDGAEQGQPLLVHVERVIGPLGSAD